MKILITTRGDFVAPRFDQSTEVIIAAYYDQQLLEAPRTILVSDVSAVSICDIALKEQVITVVCGGIEEQHYQFLTWKKIAVIDSVIGPHADVLLRVMNDALDSGAILPGAVSREVAP